MSFVEIIALTTQFVFFVGGGTPEIVVMRSPARTPEMLWSAALLLPLEETVGGLK